MNNSSPDADASSPDGSDPIPLEEINEGDGLSSSRLSSAAARTIDGICDEFERAWLKKRKAPPEVEDYWSLARERGLSNADARLLLKELMVIDLNYRQSRGLSKALHPDGYIVRFPGCRELIAEAFQAAGLSAGEPALSGQDTSRVPVETSSGFELLSSPEAGADRAHHLKSTINEMPQQLGSYVVEAELGHGGMGVVYRAFDNEMQRTVAIKVMKEDRIDSQEAMERFRREIRLLGNLNHENIVRAFHTHVDEASHTRFLVMEYVEGVELETLVGRLGPLPIPDACELIRRAAVGLSHAHENGLIHRDLKPANLMLSAKGQVKVLDLGLARPQRFNESEPGMLLTQEGQWLGTPYYMSPEQGIVQGEIDHRSDIYSLGCTLYKLLTGQTPFGHEEGATVVGILMQHANAEFPRVTDKRPEVPGGLMRILNQMVAKDPEKRPTSAAEAASQLEPYCKGSDLSALYQAYATGKADARPPVPPARRTWLLAAGGVLLLAALGGLAAFYSLPEDDEPGIDLLAEIDTDRDPVQGKWTKEAGSLRSPDPVPGACLRLPQSMPAEFDLEITAQRKEGVDLMFVHRSEETPFALAFTLRIRTSGADEDPAERSKTGQPQEAVIQKAWTREDLLRSHTLVFRVRTDGLRIEHNGETLVERSGYPELPADLAGAPDRPGFYIITDDSQYEFSRIVLTPIER